MNPYEIVGSKYYAIKGSQLERLVGAAKRLYSEQRMSGDDMRDMAQVILEGVIESVEGPIDILP